MAEALERREKERELTGNAARKMAAVLESTTDGICEIDHDWCVSFINTRARAIVAPDGDLIGTPLFEAFPEAVGRLLQRECGRAIAKACRSASTSISRRMTCGCRSVPSPHPTG